MSLAENPDNHDSAVNHLIDALQAASTRDSSAANASFTYDYFRRQIGDVGKAREEIIKVFYKALKQ